MFNWLKRLFPPVGVIPPAVNRKERRLRQSIARRKRMHNVAPPKQKPSKEKP